ncbi:MAG: DNA polymerase III subunit beta [Stellaceae bacterium]
MKLTIERGALLKALGHVQSVVERRNTIQILSNVLLQADAAGLPGGGEPGGGESGAGALALSATDMDLEMVERVPAQIERPGRTTAPAHTLYDIVRKLREGAQIEVEVSGERNAMVLRSGRSTFTLACLPAEDYPVMASGELGHSFTLTAAELRILVDRTRFAISTEETRYYLNGIYLHVTKNNEVPVIRAVATDGHRLARMEMVMPEGAAGMPGIIVPRKTIIELRKLVEESEDEIEVALSETKIRFALRGSGQDGGAALTSKLIDGTFPDYDRVIPSNNDKVLEVKCKEFAEAVDRVSTISSEKSRAVKLAIAPGANGGSLAVSATSPENGTAVEEIDATYLAEPIEIGFNSRYLLDIAAQIEGEGAQFVMSDSASPTIVCDRADPSALYVLMPMRV